MGDNDFGVDANCATEMRSASVRCRTRWSLKHSRNGGTTIIDSLAQEI